eukprot:jgi/Chrzof1/1647/Cz10g15190.t1
MRKEKHRLEQQTRRLASLVAWRLVKVASAEQTGSWQPGRLLQAMQDSPQLVADLGPLLGDMTAVAQELEGVSKELSDQQHQTDAYISAAVKAVLEDEQFEELRTDPSLQTAIKVLDNYATFKKNWKKG